MAPNCHHSDSPLATVPASALPVVLFQLTKTKPKKHFSKVYFTLVIKIKTVILCLLIKKTNVEIPQKVVN